MFLKNAVTANINLQNIDYIVLSHGHIDHTGGLNYLMDMFKNSKEKPQIIACPNIFNQRYDDIDGYIGSPVSKQQAEEVFGTIYSKEPYFITENIVFLGEIPSSNNFEPKKQIGFQKDSGLPDFVTDDSALVVKTIEGLVIITGCSHSGIANISEYAKKVFKSDKITSIIGGLHLKESSKEQINKTADYIKKQNLNTLYSCHCTGFQAQCLLNSVTNLKEVGSGLQISLE